MKPNIIRKTLHSEILNQTFRIWISQKARRCIVKKGSLDNYLLNSNPKHIDSKFGILIRDLI
jgi:ribosomal protein L28